jgi:hypothetical protein
MRSKAEGVFVPFFSPRVIESMVLHGDITVSNKVAWHGVRRVKPRQACRGLADRSERNRSSLGW